MFTLRPARSQHDVALRVTFLLSLVVFALLSALDVATTAYGVAHRGYELNPWVRAIIGHSGAVGFAAIKATGTGAAVGMFLIAYLVLPGRWRWLSAVALLAADVWLSMLIGHNFASILLIWHSIAEASHL